MATGGKRRCSKYSKLMTAVQVTKTNELITGVLTLLKGRKATHMRVAFFVRRTGSYDQSLVRVNDTSADFEGSSLSRGCAFYITIC